MTEITDAEQEAIRAGHRPYDEVGYPDMRGRCSRCGKPWPCPEIRALDRLEELEDEVALRNQLEDHPGTGLTKEHLEAAKRGVSLETFLRNRLEEAEKLLARAKPLVAATKLWQDIIDFLAQRKET